MWFIDWLNSLNDSVFCVVIVLLMFILHAIFHMLWSLHKYGEWWHESTEYEQVYDEED